jgi:spoIIIJ-associated protein
MLSPNLSTTEPVAQNRMEAPQEETLPMNDVVRAAERVADFMRLLTTKGHLRLKFRVTAGAGAVDPDGLEQREIYVECKGPDAGLLLDNDAELLRSLEHIAAKLLRLEPEEHDRVSFDANGFKAARAAALRDAIDGAVDYVDDNNRPFRFPPMNSGERRMVHMLMADSGLRTASTGEGPGRSVVLYPEGYVIPPERSYGGRDRRGGGDRDRRGGGGRGRY